VCRKEVQRPETDGHIALTSFKDVKSTTDYTTQFVSFLEFCSLKDAGNSHGIELSVLELH
jgi:hypothetical protein